MEKIRKLLIGLLIALSAACSRPTPTPTPTDSIPTATSRYSTHEGPVVRATLPPTWTPTFTPLPTLTFTPTVPTPTPSPTSAPSLADLCGSLTVDYPYPDAHTFTWNETIILTLGTTLTAVRAPTSQTDTALSLRFVATQPLGPNYGVQLASGQVFVMELPVHLLPDSGYYRWRVAVSGAGIGDQCIHEGSFFVTRSASDLLTATSIAATEAATNDTTPPAAATNDTTVIQ